MDPSNDPAVFALPHPVRVDAVVGKPADTLLFEHLGVMPLLRPYLTDPSASTEWIVNNVPGVAEIAAVQRDLGGGQNLGSFMLTVVRARLRAHGDPILEVTPTLQALLAETDLAAELPARYFRSPYPLSFIAFARPNPLRVPHRISGLHMCEGVYIGTYELPAHHEMLHHRERNRALQLDPARPVRAIELVIIGSPIGKENALDDASQDLILLIQNEDECLATVLDRHIAWFNDPVAYANPGMTPIDPQEVVMVKPVVDALAKVLLYLNLADAEQRRMTDRTALETRLRGLGPKKAAKLARKRALVYDRILIGPSLVAADAGEGVPVGLERVGDRHVKPHWRRGHFRRIRFGEGLAESRLGWIQPVLVNAAELTAGAVKTKPYVVR
jgi:hypothetical protein